MMSKASNKAGYSMMEMVVVMGIMAVTTGGVASDYVSRAPYRQLNGAVSQLTSDLRLARMEAISSKQKVQIIFLNQENGYAVWRDNDRDGLIAQAELETKTFDGKGAVSIEAYPNQGTFRPDGRFTSANEFCYVSIQTDCMADSLLISPNGYVLGSN
jgi:Tfp pilus assembly protein FimT